MRTLRRLIVGVGVFALLLWLVLPWRGPTIEPGSTLVLEISGEYVEAAEAPLLARLVGAARRPFASLLSELSKAERDKRISSVVLRIRTLEIHWAMAQELRDAIGDLRAAGKTTLAYLETGGIGANLEYYVASAADRILASPATSSPLLGLSMEYVFLGGLWEKLGAGVESLGSGEYKSGAETLTATEMSAAHREMAASILDSTYGQFVGGIAEGRGLTAEFVRDAIDRAPASPRVLEGLGLLDGVAAFDEAVDSLGSDSVVYGEDYARVDPESVGFDPVARFALVYGSGTVLVGRGGMTPSGSATFASDTVSEALEDASKDPDIAAIIFRIDSPGGSPLGSDIVWRAAERARARGKPLVASVSNYAASGGYYVIAGADAIVAPPGSLVGSIGVFVIRPVIGGLLEKLGIGVETMSRGAHADILATTLPLTESGRERLLADVMTLYDTFVARVSAGRDMTPERVHEVGRGRVFTGLQAKENGLVDELGGIRTAVRRAKVLAGLDPDDDVWLIPYPAPQTLVEQFGEALRGAVVRATPTLPLPAVVRRLGPLLDALPDGAPALVPPMLVEIH